jgi:hypothetical protein
LCATIYKLACVLFLWIQKLVFHGSCTISYSSKVAGTFIPLTIIQVGGLLGYSKGSNSCAVGLYYCTITGSNSKNMDRLHRGTVACGLDLLYDCIPFWWLC